MITFKQFLAEIFDNPFPYDKLNSIADEAKYGFYVDGTLIKVIIDYGKDRGNKIFSISFVGQSGYNLTKRNRDQFRILATVKSIIFNHFDNINLRVGDRIVFDTYDHTTKNLYSKFAKELAKRTGMRLNQVTYESKIGSGKQITDFELIKE